eukprot:1295274-Heterocapsa_arctica.AAC.1
MFNLAVCCFLEMCVPFHDRTILRRVLAQPLLQTPHQVLVFNFTTTLACDNGPIVCGPPNDACNSTTTPFPGTWSALGKR